MATTVKCPKCLELLHVPDGVHVARARCKQCKHVIDIAAALTALRPAAAADELSLGSNLRVAAASHPQRPSPNALPRAKELPPATRPSANQPPAYVPPPAASAPAVSIPLAPLASSGPPLRPLPHDPTRGGWLRSGSKRKRRGQLPWWSLKREFSAWRAFVSFLIFCSCYGGATGLWRAMHGGSFSRYGPTAPVSAQSDAWQTAELPGFVTVEFPGAFEPFSKSQHGVNLQGSRCRATISREFAVAETLILSSGSAGGPTSVQQYVERVRAFAERDSAVTTSQTPIQVQGVTGVEVVIERKILWQTERHIFRVFIMDRYFVLLIASGKEVSSADEDVRRFFDSMRITAPSPVRQNVPPGLGGPTIPFPAGAPTLPGAAAPLVPGGVAPSPRPGLPY